MPKASSCPHCFQRITERLWFQCTGEDGCEPVVDPARSRRTGFNEPDMPAFPPPGRQLTNPRLATCPKRGGVTGRRACPDCHTPLQPDFGDDFSPLIAMIGAKGTGKTVYLTVLGNELTTRIGSRFEADVRPSGSEGHGSEVSPRVWLRQNIESIYFKGLLPAQTAGAVRGRQQPLVFEWRRPATRRLLGGYQTSYLSFYDTAGEDLGTTRAANDLVYMGAANGLILLLDPFKLPEASNRAGLSSAAQTSIEDVREVLGHVTDSLRNRHGVRRNGRIPVPVAIAFAKMDAFFGILNDNDPIRQSPAKTAFYDEAAGRSTHERMKRLLHEWGGDNIELHCRMNYDSHRYFCLSALGAEPDYENLRVDAGGVRPFRVEEPLLWLLSKFRVVDTRTSG